MRDVAKRDAQPRLRVGTESTDPHAVTAASGEKRRRAPTDPYAKTHASDVPPTSDGSGHGEHPDAHDPDPLLGTTLAHFRIDGPLGRGGMGEVYRGWDTALERPVAIKVLSVDHPQARERFLREARAQAKVRHPNVVPIHFVGSQDGRVFLSMDLVEGASMAERLKDAPIPIDEALDVADAVAEALAEGQKSGLIHRDVKPSNVLRTREGRILLADFGLAKAVGGGETARREDAGGDGREGREAAEDEAASGATSSIEPVLTHHGAIVGTPAYIAPEQTRPGPTDHRADMYALGVTVYEMITGERPFTASDSATLLLQHREVAPPPARSRVRDLPPAVDALIERLMQKDPANRFADFASLRSAIDAARNRAAPSAGFFARASATAVDFVPSALLAAAFAGLSLPLGFLAVALGWAMFERRWGKTLGKRLFALRVVEAHDERPKIPKVLLRNLSKYWGLIAIDIVQALPKARWHDVVVVVVLLAWILGFVIAAGSKKLALHDRLSRTRVVYALDRPRP